MRFCKGAKVEVLSTKEVATGAWHCAEIIHGNGHTYNVKYGWFPMTSNPVVERVPRKAIRPCPPPVEWASDLVPGNLVEAFHNLSWKPARILEVIGENNFLVRLLGLSTKFGAHKSHLRIRRCWQDSKWFVVGQGMEDRDICKGKKQPDIEVKQSVEDDCFQVNDNIEIPKPHIVSTKILKRGSPLGVHNFKVHEFAAEKKRMIGKDGSHQKIISLHTSSTLKKVDTVYSKEKLHQNNMNSSIHVGESMFWKSNNCGRNDSSPIGSTISDADSFTSSVGSCSAMSTDDYNLSFISSADYASNRDDCFSDAESSCGVEYKEKSISLSTNEVLGLDIHRSELCAYHSAIQSLHASGLLTWEDEEKLTNLREVLQISDDEHLMVLRNLISANNKNFS